MLKNIGLVIGIANAALSLLAFGACFVSMLRWHSITEEEERRAAMRSLSWPTGYD